MYSVVGSDGQVYGPVDMATLSQWIAEGRVTPTTNLIDPLDGRVIQAGHAPALMGNFPNIPPQSPPMPAPQRPTNPYDGGLGPSPFEANPHQPLSPYPQGGMLVSGPPKSKAAAAVLAFFLGFLGIHRFYLGHTSTAIAMLATFIFGFILCGIPSLVVSVWALVDFVLILTGGLREANGRALV